MSDENFKKAVISSFSNAKTHISSLENQVESLKSVLLRQNEVIRQLTERILALSEPSKNHFFYSSTGNDGVKQSINQSINQSIKQSLSTKEPENTLNEDFLSTSSVTESKNEENSLIPEQQKQVYRPLPVKFTLKDQELSSKPSNLAPHKEINEKFLIETSPKPLKTLQKDILDENFQTFKQNLNIAFGALSKQELKAFLTVYQLDEGNQGASYQELAQKMGLTETCIRAYISSLFKKGLPLSKMKINNKKTIVTIKQDFKSLNLKSKIIALYYEKDPYQTSIFDLKE